MTGSDWLDEELDLSAGIQAFDEEDEDLDGDDLDEDWEDDEDWDDDEDWEDDDLDDDEEEDEDWEEDDDLY